jgi:hypothetical protein
MLTGVVAMEHKEMLRRSTPNPVARAAMAELRIDSWLIEVVSVADLASIATGIVANHHLFLSSSMKKGANRNEERKDFCAPRA